MTVRSKGQGTKTRFLADIIEHGDVSMPPEDVQREAALNLASQADSPEALREVLVVLGLIPEHDPSSFCGKGHRLNEAGLCVKCDSKTLRRTHCRNGHEYTPETTQFDPSGRRKCLTCYQATLTKHRNRRRQPCLWCGGKKEPGNRHLCTSCLAKRDGRA